MSKKKYTKKELKHFVQVSKATFNEYCIVEEDFLRILDFIPLETNKDLKAYSHRFADIIKRSCSGIEIYLREWMKLGDVIIPEDLKNNQDKDPKNPKSRLNFGDYRRVFKTYLRSSEIQVRQLNSYIYPYAPWKKDESCSWWNAYAELKHNGFMKRTEATLENALYALSAWIIVLCRNPITASYLTFLSSPSCFVTKSGGQTITMLDYIKFPLDNSRYLFFAEFGNGNCFSPKIYMDFLKAKLSS